MSPRQCYVTGIARASCALIAAWCALLAWLAAMPGLSRLCLIGGFGLLLNGAWWVVKGANQDNAGAEGACANGTGGSPTEHARPEASAGPGSTHSTSGMPATQTGVAALYGRYRASASRRAR